MKKRNDYLPLIKLIIDATASFIEPLDEKCKEESNEEIVKEIEDAIFDINVFSSILIAKIMKAVISLGKDEEKDVREKEIEGIVLAWCLNFEDYDANHFTNLYIDFLKGLLNFTYEKEIDLEETPIEIQIAEKKGDINNNKVNNDA
jgi:hypothetical protein